MTAIAFLIGLSMLLVTAAALAGVASADSAKDCEPQINPDPSWIFDCIPAPPEPRGPDNESRTRVAGTSG